MSTYKKYLTVNDFALYVIHYKLQDLIKDTDEYTVGNENYQCTYKREKNKNNEYEYTITITHKDGVTIIKGTEEEFLDMCRGKRILRCDDEERPYNYVCVIDPFYEKWLKDRRK